MTSAPAGSDKIGDLLAAGRTLSFEFFPPKSDEAERQLEKTIHELARWGRRSCRSPTAPVARRRDRTRDIVVQVNREQPFPAMAHLTCSGHAHQVVALLDEYADAGIHNILALAGDPPADGSDPGGDFTYATELVELVRGHRGDFSVGVAAHPELHPRSHGDRRPTVATWPPSWRWPTSPSPSSSRGRRLPAHGRGAGRAGVVHAGAARRHAPGGAAAGHAQAHGGHERLGHPRPAARPARGGRRRRGHQA